MPRPDPTAEIHGFSSPDASPTPWTTGLTAIRDAEVFWISTVRPDGRPHVTPLVAVWHDDALWFTTGADEVKARNLDQNPGCVLTTGVNELAVGFDVTVEGHAERIDDRDLLAPVATAYATKYGRDVWDFRPVDGGFRHAGPVDDAHHDSLVFRLRPTRDMGFRHGEVFSQTTWEFAD